MIEYFKNIKAKQIEEWIFVIDSWRAWKTVTIMVWVHGDELSWVRALNKIWENLNIISWRVYFIYWNLQALKINKREYQKNLNRCFVKNNTWENYEDKRARQIIKYLDKSDYLLDVHNTLNTENSIPFLISEYKQMDKIFFVEKIVSWFDNLHPWWSDSYMNDIWKVGLCLECWSIYDYYSIEIAEKGILNFLKYTGNISWKVEEYNNQEKINFDYIYKNKFPKFRFNRKFLDFELVKAWEIIWYDWNEEIKFNEDKIVLFPYEQEKVWWECFCLGNII